MIPHSPKPLRMSLDDQIETRIYQTKQSMRFPVDKETTAKLKRVIRLDASTPLPWTRKLLRWLKWIR
jgi:hypothetical protein